MPHDIIRQPDDLVPGALRHLREALGFGLVFKGVAGEVDAGAMHVGFDEDVDAADAVELDFFVFVLTPVAHACHVGAVGAVFFVA